MAGKIEEKGQTGLPPEGVYYADDGKGRVKVTVKSERLDVDMLKAEHKALQERIDAIPDEPDEKTLLAWALEHYPRMDYTAERAALEARLSEIVTALGE